MTPNSDERLASIIRALTEVILPQLPPEASLAQEQLHLSVGHLQILRAQFDAIPAYEREELDDAITIGKALKTGVSGGVLTQQAVAGIGAAIAAADGSHVRGQCQAIHDAIDALVRAVAVDGDIAGKAELRKIILELEHVRAQKDRRWFAPFGFDTL
ncbi:MAG: hypothetical protein RLY97_268 [Pseudomonadota bacterium]|jgi:hypothetical protein